MLYEWNKAVKNLDRKTLSWFFSPLLLLLFFSFCYFSLLQTTLCFLPPKPPRSNFLKLSHLTPPSSRTQTSNQPAITPQSVAHLPNTCNPPQLSGSLNPTRTNQAAPPIITQQSSTPLGPAPPPSAHSPAGLHLQATPSATKTPRFSCSLAISASPPCRSFRPPLVPVPSGPTESIPSPLWLRLLPTPAAPPVTTSPPSELRPSSIPSPTPSSPVQPSRGPPPDPRYRAEAHSSCRRLLPSTDDPLSSSGEPCPPPQPGRIRRRSPFPGSRTKLKVSARSFKQKKK